MPDIEEGSLGGEVVAIDLKQPMDAIQKTLTNYPVRTRLSLTGPMIVARDLAHLKISERPRAGSRP